MQSYSTDLSTVMTSTNTVFMLVTWEYGGLVDNECFILAHSPLLPAPKDMQYSVKSTELMLKSDCQAWDS